MGVFTKQRKSRATRRAEAKALKTKAKYQAKYEAQNEERRIKADERARARAAEAQLRRQREADRSTLKAAQIQAKAARDGKFMSPARVRRTLMVTRLLAPVLVPLCYRLATVVRGHLDQRRADQLGVPLAQLGQFSGHGGALSARIAGSEKSLRTVAADHPKDPETRQFVAATTARLTDLAAAVNTAETMPPARRRTALAAVSDQLDGIEADLLGRLGVG